MLRIEKNEYFNVLIFGSLDPKNIDLEMAIRKEWKYVINLIIFTGTLVDIYTLVFLIEVQDILIIFQHFLSQEVLIKDRTAIFFSQISDKKQRKYENIRKMVKLHAKYNVKKLKIVEILLPGSLFKGGCLLDF